MIGATGRAVRGLAPHFRHRRPQVSMLAGYSCDMRARSCRPEYQINNPPQAAAQKAARALASGKS